MNTVADLRPTIIPKSDQLNAEQLLTGPITITVTEVDVSASKEQPVTVHYVGEDGRPYKPCLTMRKVLVLAWGHDGTTWAGKSMTLYCDPGVKWGGVEVGGIRIAAMSDIDRPIACSLTATRGKKVQHLIEVLKTAPKPAAVDHLAAINNAGTVDALKDAFAAAYKSTKDAGKRVEFKRAYDDCLALFNSPPEDA